MPVLHLVKNKQSTEPGHVQLCITCACSECQRLVQAFPQATRWGISLSRPSSGSPVAGVWCGIAGSPVSWLVLNRARALGAEEVVRSVPLCLPPGLMRMGQRGSELGERVEVSGPAAAYAVVFAGVVSSSGLAWWPPVRNRSWLRPRRGPLPRCRQLSEGRPWEAPRSVTALLAITPPSSDQTPGLFDPSLQRPIVGCGPERDGPDRGDSFASPFQAQSLGTVCP